MVADTNRQSNMHMVACGIIYHQNWESAHHYEVFLTAGDLNSTEIDGRSIEIFEMKLIFF